MTETEWLRSTDPVAMLRWLNPANAEECAAVGTLGQQRCCTARKLRLYAVACCHFMWSSFVYSRTLASIFAAEAFADGRVTGIHLDNSGMRDPVWVLAYNACRGDIRNINDTEQAVAKIIPPSIRASFLRDIFGNPWHSISIEGKDAWHDGAIRKLAQSMYDSRDFSYMPALADMFEEAGCEDARILSHCRGIKIGGNGRCDCNCATRCPLGRTGMELRCTAEELAPYQLHYRGCWVVDLILGKL